jgi:hypothetical protein
MNSTIGQAEIISDRLAIVYDGATGQLLHIHRVTTMKGGKSRSDEALQQTALEHAATMLPKEALASAQVILAEPHIFKPGHAHKVDVKRRVVLNEPRKS